MLKDKYIGLLQTLVNYGCKIFYNIGLWNQFKETFFFFLARATGTLVENISYHPKGEDVSKILD
jgi:hypothetical protein